MAGLQGETPEESEDRLLVEQWIQQSWKRRQQAEKGDSFVDGEERGFDEGEKGEGEGDHPTCIEGGSDGQSKDSGPPVFRLEREIKVWSDFLKCDFHPRTLSLVIHFLLVSWLSYTSHVVLSLSGKFFNASPLVVASLKKTINIHLAVP